MLKKTLIRAALGFLIGIVIGNVIAILTGTSDTGGVTFASKRLLDIAGGNGALAMFFQSLFSGLYGAACFAGMSAAGGGNSAARRTDSPALHPDIVPARLGRQYPRDRDNSRDPDRSVLYDLADFVFCI